MTSVYARRCLTLGFVVGLVAGLTLGARLGRDDLRAEYRARSISLSSVSHPTTTVTSSATSGRAQPAKDAGMSASNMTVYSVSKPVSDRNGEQGARRENGPSSLEDKSTVTSVTPASSTTTTQPTNPAQDGNACSECAGPGDKVWFRSEEGKCVATSRQTLQEWGYTEDESCAK